MHWKQREMLFEQTETSKGNIEEKRQPQDTGFGAKSPKLREPDARVASKSGKPRTGGGLQGPGKKKKRRSFEGAHVNEQDGPGPRPAGPGGPRPLPQKRQPDERTKSKKPEDKLAKSRKLGKAKRQDEGKHLLPKKKKTESHCEAYAEAYVRGVEAALAEKRKVTKDRRLRTNRGVVPTTRAKAPKR